MKSIINKLQSKARKIANIYMEKTFQPYAIPQNVDGVTFNFLIGDLDRKITSI